MNQRNVDALFVLLLDAKGPRGDPVLRAAQATVLSEFLAERVLVPSAMSDDDCRAVSVRDGDGAWEDYLAPAVRAELERIAKGEAA